MLNNMYHGHSHGRILGARANDRRGAKVPCETSIPKGRGEGINGLVFLGKSSPEITGNHGYSHDEFPVNCQPKSMESGKEWPETPVSPSIASMESGKEWPETPVSPSIAFWI